MKRLALTIAVPTALCGLLLIAAPADATHFGHNGRIAFRRYLNADHTYGAIFTIRPDGTRLRQLTHPPRTRLTVEPDWSPNGRWIAYSVYRHGDEDQSRIYKIHPNGTGRTSLAGSCTGTCVTEDFPAWGPAGKRIAFQRGVGTIANHSTFLFMMRADGTHLRQITQRGGDPTAYHPLADVSPQWSPDAKRLVFQRLDQTTDRSAIFTVRLDGTGLRRITRWRLDAGQPDWSPNGRWIAFKSQWEGRRPNNVWVVRPNGTDLHRITHNPGTYTWLTLSFSPDGRFITVARTPGHGEAGNADVYVMRRDGSNLRNVTNSYAWDSTPDWGRAQGSLATPLRKRPRTLEHRVLFLVGWPTLGSVLSVRHQRFVPPGELSGLPDTADLIPAWHEQDLRVCRAAWRLGVSVREYREIEAGDRTPSLDTYQRIFELFGWPQTFM